MWNGEGSLLLEQQQKTHQTELLVPVGGPVLYSCIARPRYSLSPNGYG